MIYDKIARRVHYVEIHSPGTQENGSLTAAARDQEESSELDTDAILWSRIHAVPGEQMKERILALYQLARSPDLPAFVVTELERGDLTPPWRDAIVVAAENVLFPDPDHRARVARSLRSIALSLRAEPGSEQVLCAAVWRYTTLIPEERLGTLLDFLRPEDRVLTWQVALQSISNAFSRRLPDASLPLGDVRSRVEELADLHITEGAIGNAERRALTVSLYCAVAALGSGELGVMTDRLLLLDRRSMVRRARQLLAPVERAWTVAAPASEPLPGALVGLREALESLSAVRWSLSPQS